MTDTIAPDQPRRGRPPKYREPTHEPTHEPVHGVTAVGRDGQILSRKRTDATDPFDIPLSLIEEGWEMQWIAHSVIGNTDVVQDQHLMMLENGWTPVPANRPGFVGRFMPVGATGNIIRGGQGLYERPKVLCDESRREQHLKAYQQLKDRDEALMGHKANLKGAIPTGFELAHNTDYRGRGTAMSMDTGLDGFAPRPKYNLADE